MDETKTSDHIQINIRVKNPSQECPASSQAPNEDFKDMDVLCTFKIKIESQILEHLYIKEQWHIQIEIKMPNPSQEPPAYSKAQYQDLKDMDVLCTFKIRIESQKSAYGCTKDQWPYPNQYPDAEPQSGTSSVL